MGMKEEKEDNVAYLPNHESRENDHGQIEHLKGHLFLVKPQFLQLVDLLGRFIFDKAHEHGVL